MSSKKLTITMNGKKEEFKKINFFKVASGMYKISNMGRVVFSSTGEEVKYGKSSGNCKYKTCCLKLKDGSYKKFIVHILVAKAFLSKTNRDKKFKRNLIHCHDFQYMVDAVDFLKYSNKKEITLRYNLYKAYKENNYSSNKTYLELCAKYVYILYKDKYNIDDIIYVLGDYIKVKNVRRFIDNVMKGKTYKNVIESL